METKKLTKNSKVFPFGAAERVMNTAKPFCFLFFLVFFPFFFSSDLIIRLCCTCVSRFLPGH